MRIDRPNVGLHLTPNVFSANDGLLSRNRHRNSPDTVTARPPFIAVSVATLFPSRTIGVSLYRRDQQNAPMRLYRGPDYPFAEKDIQQLLENDVKSLYVSSQEYDAYQQYLRDCLPAVLSDESLPVQRRFENLNEVVRDVLSETFQRRDTDQAVNATRELGKHTVDLICRDDVVATDLCDVLYHDYHTFTHSANVAYYSVLLAKEIGIDDRTELNAMATGALLHDLGKLEVPESVLTKPGKLSDDEFNLIRRHPTIGFRKLCDREDMSFAQLMMVYQHHERINGKGYPVGLVDDDIHPWARICAVADVYEALTSDRPYRRGLLPSEAFDIMGRESGTGLDKGLFECWKKIISGN